MSIRFAELPEGRGTSNGAWREEAETLRNNPGKWAHIENYDDRPSAHKATLAGNIKAGRIKAFRDGTFEARVIEGQVWARFVSETA